MVDKLSSRQGSTWNQSVIDYPSRLSTSWLRRAELLVAIFGRLHRMCDSLEMKVRTTEYVFQYRLVMTLS